MMVLFYQIQIQWWWYQIQWWWWWWWWFSFGSFSTRYNNDDDTMMMMIIILGTSSLILSCSKWSLLQIPASDPTGPSVLEKHRGRKRVSDCRDRGPSRVSGKVCKLFLELLILQNDSCGYRRTWKRLRRAAVPPTQRETFSGWLPRSSQSSPLSGL